MPDFRVYPLTDSNEAGRTPVMVTDRCANAVQWAYANMRRWTIKSGPHIVCTFYGETDNGGTGFGDLALPQILGD